MDQSFSSAPFYSTFGEFKKGYNRKEAETGINEGFHQRQRQRQERYLKELILGSGIGNAAEQTVHSGIYQPQAALKISANAELESTLALLGVKDKNNEKGETSKKLSLSDMGILDSSPSNIMKQFNNVEVEVRTIGEFCQQLNDNMKIAEESIAQGCHPFNFDSLLDSISIALNIVEEGDAKIKVILPIQNENSKPLIGAESVMAYTQEYITPRALMLVTILYATEWMLQYSMIFINSLFVKNEEEAQIRLQLLAKCVRWLGKIDQFIAFAFSLELKWESYEAFSKLRDSAEYHIGGLLNSIENDINSILLSPFPTRRKQLVRLDGSIGERLRRVLKFLNDIEDSWMPDVKFQIEWKNEFLSRMLKKIHTIIAPGFLSASLGFIDESLYKLVTGNRDSSLVFRSNSSTNMNNNNNNNNNNNSVAPVKSTRRSLPPRANPNVSLATQVENGRVKEGLSFQQIGVALKESASFVVGLQLCMGARFVLRQSGSEFDERWGFSMGETAEAPDAVRDAVDGVSRFTDVLMQRIRERLEGELSSTNIFEE